MARNTITESKFKAVKIMLNGGATIEECAAYLQISASSVRRIRDAEDFEDYQHYNYVRSNAYFANKEAKKEEEKKEEPEPEIIPAPVQPVVQEVIHKHEQSITIIANHYMAEQLQKQTELLTLISNKLAFIVDELCGVPVKKEV